MSKPETVLEAGKQIAAIASGRARKLTPEEVLHDPKAERQGPDTGAQPETEKKP